MTSNRPSMLCLLGSHRWIGSPPVGLPGGLCWRTCERCGRRSYGYGYVRLDVPVIAAEDAPKPGGIRV